MNSPKYKNKYRIESNRLKDYDYSGEGAYFITICSKDKSHVLGKVIKEEFIGNELAEISKQSWYDLPNHYNNCFLDEFVVMPNHIHGIIKIIYPIVITYAKMNHVETGFKPVSTGIAKKYPLSEMMRAFKTFSTRKINDFRKTPGGTFWQKNYYDRVIRSEKEMEIIQAYIYYNPLRWDWDKNNFEKTLQNRE